jgi:hypothetical protein
MKIKILRWSVIVLLVLGTVAALFYAEENWRGAHAWEKVEAELKAKGEPLTIAEMIPPPVPDNENVAEARVFKEIFEHDKVENPKQQNLSPLLIEGLKKILSNHSQKLDLSKGIAPELVDRENLHKFFEDHGKEMAEIENALARPKLRWDLEYEKAFAVRIPHISAALDTTKILQLRALVRLESGESDQAFQDIRLMLRMSDRVRQDAFLVGYLVSLSCESLAQQVIWHGLQKRAWSDNQLKELQGLFPSGLQYVENYKQSMRWERAFFFNTVEYLRAGDYVKELSSLSISGNPPSFFERAMITALSLRPKGWLDLERAHYSRFVQDGVFDASNIEDCFKRAKIFDDLILRKASSLRERFTAPLFITIMPSLKAIVGKTMQAVATMDMARTACAIERYRMTKGKIPLKLEELVPTYLEQVPVDPVNGDPIHYIVKNDKDYLLYSVGLNEKDDGGYTSKKKELGDWVWPSCPGLVEVRDN